MAAGAARLRPTAWTARTRTTGVPTACAYTASLEDDLARRDFTINAMAMDAAGAVTDPFGGREDIGRRLIRCVGEPERRFNEDALRMLRAVRFAAKLGFEIDGPTLAAALECAPLAASLSAERVAAELRGILASPGPDRSGPSCDWGLLAAWSAPRRGGATREPGPPARATPAWRTSARAGRRRAYRVGPRLPARAALGRPHARESLRRRGDPRLRLARLQAPAARLRARGRAGRLSRSSRRLQRAPALRRVLVAGRPGHERRRPRPWATPAASSGKSCPALGARHRLSGGQQA